MKQPPYRPAAGGNYLQGAVLHFEFRGDIDGVDFPDTTIHVGLTVGIEVGGHMHGA